MEPCREYVGPRVGRNQKNLYPMTRGRGVHVLAYEEVCGPIPKGKVVMHECDNPRCVNINHLRLGTQQENVQDCIRKGRGNRTGRPSDLTEETAIYAMARMLVGEPRKQVADSLGCTRQALADLFCGRTFQRCFQGEGVG
jgi:hypothetical protein